MQVFKMFILMLIFGSSSLIGILISKKYTNRVQNLKEIKNALNILETKIRFTYEPLADIFSEISNNTSNNIASIFKEASLKIKFLSVKEAWIDAITNVSLDLNDEDKNVIKSLGNMLRANRCRWTSITHRSYQIFYRYANQ